jgi:hypothetical protein
LKTGTLEDFLETQDFYELMQAYRWSGILHGGREEDVVKTFEAVKEFVRIHTSLNSLNPTTEKEKTDALRSGVREPDEKSI